MRVEMTGLQELQDALKRLPQDLTYEATSILAAHAEEAYRQIYDKYPVREYGRKRGRGNLRRGLTLRNYTDRFSVFAVLRNTANHAYIYEHGTEMRHTARGQSRGAMPPGRVFIPIALRQKRIAVEALKELVRRHGFAVNGAEVASTSLSLAA
jgi:hypothetical protein